MPIEYFNTDVQPKVTVYNHPAWGNKIDNLVHEIAEISRVITSKVNQDSKYNFNLHKINIKKETINTKKISQDKKEITVPKKLGFASDNKKKIQEFTNVKTHRLTIRETQVEYNKYTLEQATNEIFTMLYVFDINKKTNVFEKIPREYIKKLINKELRSIGEDFVSEQNMQRAKQAFGVSFRSAVGLTEIKDLFQNVTTMNTSEMSDSFISEGAFKNNGTLVTCDEYYDELNDDDAKMIEDLNNELKSNQTTLSEDDESFYIRGKIIKNISLDQYKSPINITLLSHTPEREFIEIFLNDYPEFVDSWIKSKDKGFYSIPYIHRPGTHSLQKDFNPDFFFKKGKEIVVVEIKSGNDLSIKNKDKLDGAIEYFNKLNDKLKGKVNYDFYFLAPGDYRQFFENKFKNNLKFKGKLHADLESKTREALKDGR